MNLERLGLYRSLLQKYDIGLDKYNAQMFIIAIYEERYILLYLFLYLKFRRNGISVGYEECIDMSSLQDLCSNCFIVLTILLPTGFSVKFAFLLYRYDIPTGFPI